MPFKDNCLIDQNFTYRRDGRYIKTLWKEVQVGDIVHLSCNEVIPADILLLKCSDEQGLCYIETANIDGESNLKQREVARGLINSVNKLLVFLLLYLLWKTYFLITNECWSCIELLYDFCNATTSQFCLIVALIFTLSYL